MCKKKSCPNKEPRKWIKGQEIEGFCVGCKHKGLFKPLKIEKTVRKKRLSPRANTLTLKGECPKCKKTMSTFLNESNISE